MVRLVNKEWSTWRWPVEGPKHVVDRSCQNILVIKTLNKLCLTILYRYVLSFTWHCSRQNCSSERYDITQNICPKNACSENGDTSHSIRLSTCKYS